MTPPLLVDGSAEQRAISGFNDPFQKACVEYIRIHSFPRMSGNWKGSVEFKNGRTNGEQTFEAETMADLVIEMQEFIKALP